MLTRELSAPQCDLVYWELRNVLRRYLSTCSSPRYGSSFFGLRKATPEGQRRRAGEDLWRMSCGLARVSGKGQLLRLWCEACRDEAAAYDRESAARFAELEREAEAGASAQQESLRSRRGF